MTQAQKAQSTVAALAKRKATLARNCAQFRTPIDERSNIDNSYNEEQHYSATAPTILQDTIANISNDIKVLAKPSSYKRKAPISKTIIPKQYKRRTIVMPIGSPIIIIGPKVAKEKEDNSASKDEQEYQLAKEEVSPSNTILELPNKS